MMTELYPGRPAGRSWLREPLLHFVVLGGLLFAADNYLYGRTDDPHTIVIDAAADQEMKQVFRNARGHDPDARELAAVREQWVNNEVLYREGLALKLDKGDKSIQDRVAFKMLSVIETNVKAAPVDDATLRRYFEAHRVEYDEPERLDFAEAALKERPSEQQVRDLVKELNAGAPGDAKAELRLFKARPYPTVEQAFGKDAARALKVAKLGEWEAQETQYGWVAIRVVSVTPPLPAKFESSRALVHQRWIDANAADQRTKAVLEIRRKYRVKIEAGAA